MDLNKNIFKANDIRGIYPSEINKDIVYKIVFGIKDIFKKTVVVGRDARLSSPELYKSVLGALSQKNNLKIIEAGLITTPAMYFLVNKFKADGGIMVTASHNPKEYNGLKIVGKKAVPMSGRSIFDLFSKRTGVRSVQRGTPPASRPENFRKVENLSFQDSETSLRQQIKNNNFYLKEYAKFLKRFIKIKRPLRIVFDCSNGVAGLVLKDLLGGNKKIDPVFINEKPDGNFPAHSPNPLVSGSLDQIKKEVIKRRADLGIIFDADGDRVFFVDNKGNKIDPDIIGYILMNKFKSPYVVSTISSWRVKKVRGAIVARVGHLFMKEMMRKKKASLGMERSGHYYFKNFFYCDSGVLAALEIINFIGNLKIKFSDCVEMLPVYYQIPESNFSLSAGAKNKDLEKKILKIENIYKPIAKKIKKDDGLLVEMEDWWFSLRFSNSENLFRLNIEGDSQELINLKHKELKRLILN